MFPPIAADLTLVLTACVDPKGMSDVSRPDPRDRERDYIDCLRYYLATLCAIRRVVLVENSGWPLEHMKRSVADLTAGKTVEYLSLDANDYPRERGKSYGEMLMLEHAVAESRLVRDSAYLGKLTARNYLRNLERLLGGVRRPFGLLCDLRDHPFYEWAGSKSCGRHCDTRFFVCTPSFFRSHLVGTYERMSSEYSVEALLYEVAKAPQLRNIVIRRFPIEPDFAGLSGHLLADGTARSYSSPNEVLKRRVRAVTRHLLPWVHI